MNFLKLSAMPSTAASRLVSASRRASAYTPHRPADRESRTPLDRSTPVAATDRPWHHPRPSRERPPPPRPAITSGQPPEQFARAGAIEPFDIPDSGLDSRRQDLVDRLQPGEGPNPRCRTSPCRHRRAPAGLRTSERAVRTGTSDHAREASHPTARVACAADRIQVEAVAAPGEDSDTHRAHPSEAEFAAGPRGMMSTHW